MEYNFINPSDPYTFIAKDQETAALTVFLLGTCYGAEAKEGGDIPVFLFGGSEDWYKEQFGRTPDEGFTSEKEAVADALQSFMYGTFKDRHRYEAALAAITDQVKKESFIKEWQDGHGSLNDIGSYAHKLGQKIREGIPNSTSQKTETEESSSIY